MGATAGSLKAPKDILSAPESNARVFGLILKNQRKLSSGEPANETNNISYFRRRYWRFALQYYFLAYWKSGSHSGYSFV
jgi:hypothetical protein